MEIALKDGWRTTVPIPNGESQTLLSNARPPTTPGVSLDGGGIGDMLCALRAATGAGLPFVPPASQREWAELLIEPVEITNPSIKLRLTDYRYGIDQAVAPRWKFWQELCGGRGWFPTLRPIPDDIQEAAVRYAGRVVLSPFSSHGPSLGADYNRSWPVDRWMEVNRLLIEAGHRTLILDSQEERCHRFQSCQPVENEPGARVGDRTDLLCGKSPQMVAAVMRWATAFAGNDSGMAHLAGTLGVPGVAVCSAVSDVDIFGCYPSITQLGRRGKSFDLISPLQVVETVNQSVLTSPIPWNCKGWKDKILVCDRWRIAGWVDVYRTLWKVVSQLQPTTIVEIGCRAGYSSWIMLQMSSRPTIQAYDADIAEHGGFVGAMSHAKSYLPADRWSLTKINTRKLTSLPACELVYVDGDHSDQGCYDDLQLALTARPKWIIVDDIANCWQTVKVACDRFARENDLKPRFFPSATGLYLFTLT